MLSGGNCGRGALAAGLSEAATQAGLVESPSNSLASWGTLRGAAEAGLVGGIAARVTGGKFDDGFTISAAGYIFNSAADDLKDSRARHDAAVAQEVQLLRSQGYTVLGTEVYATNPDDLFLRRYDIVVQNDTGTVFGVEVKTTITGIYKLNPQQVEFDVDTVRGGTTLLGSGIPVNGVMYRGVNFGGTLNAMASTLGLASQLNAQEIPWHYSSPPIPGH